MFYSVRIMQFLKDPPGLTSPLGIAIGAATAASAAAITYYMASKPDSYPTPVDMDNQSLSLPVRKEEFNTDQLKHG